MTLTSITVNYAHPVLWLGVAILSTVCWIVAARLTRATRSARTAARIAAWSGLVAGVVAAYVLSHIAVTLLFHLLYPALWVCTACVPWALLVPSAVWIVSGPRASRLVVRSAADRPAF